ncbi:uncharacterized protein EDB91DRAFT_1120689 [Suillus paluster]|uniref:uncharacterized protein n=1 Tax=Suillus paluster TaxID=48578 RepID=UPI001B875B0B|nr:uncharacterized protein EDB91DRAFT_1120689 [Suillus paluster]KAG1745401.1 hypothetical protein EDB91DRAFT_1120689 [Suillus paluster]
MLSIPTATLIVKLTQCIATGLLNVLTMPLTLLDPRSSCCSAPTVSSLASLSSPCLLSDLWRAFCIMRAIAF